MTEAHVVEGFLLSLNQFISNTRVEFLGNRVPHPSNQPWGCVCADGMAELWFCHDPAKPALTFRIRRDEVGLSELELSLLARIPQAIAELGKDGAFPFLNISLRFSNKIGFGDLLVAQFLDTAGAPALNSHISILNVLQDLSFRYYEDKRCSSGLYVTKDPTGFIQRVRDSNFAWYPFDDVVELHPGFFDSPATYRYVDGRNSYYLADDRLRIHGIMRLRNPDSYSLVARLRNKHLAPILTGMPGNPWLAFVGLKEEVFVVVNPDLQLKWSKNHWQLRDRTVMFTLLDRFSLKQDLQELLVSLLFALSEGGYGASILIPEDASRLPESIGKIDHTRIGDQLRSLIQRSSIAELNTGNTLLGIVGSDGLTTISRDGQILSCGDIIDISRAAQLQSQGGGRSQAGIAASFYGLSIKISQNGPISFFHQGRLLLQF